MDSMKANHLIIFFDVLGQTDSLKSASETPLMYMSDEEAGRCIELTMQNIEKIEHIRELFKMYFSAISKSVPFLTNIGENDISTAALTQEISHYCISDSVIIAVPLHGGNEDNIYGLFLSLMATCIIGILSLGDRIPVRAGLDTGIAVKIGKNEIYGPALVSAYKLESKLAEYPRFLVGEELRRYLRKMKRQDDNCVRSKLTKVIASYCYDMIMQDTDGRWMLDFIGDIVKKFNPNTMEDSTIKSAYDFAKTNYGIYLTDNNEKLASRYYRLMKYFESRKNLWNIE